MLRMRSTLEIGVRSYSRAMKVIPRNAGLEMALPRDAPSPDEREVAEWIAVGNACLRVRVTRRGRKPPSKFEMLLDGVATTITMPSGHPLLLRAGQHALASATASPLGRYYATVNLIAGDDVTVDFKGGWITAQHGSGWGSLAPTNQLP
jgi:hypothetical protein